MAGSRRRERRIFFLRPPATTATATRTAVLLLPLQIIIAIVALLIAHDDRRQSHGSGGVHVQSAPTLCVSTCPEGPVSSLKPFDQIDLHHRCSLTMWTDPPYTIADGAIGWYKCIHDACGYDCEGLFVHRAFVFWNETSSSLWDIPPSCSRNVTSCRAEELDVACRPDEPRSCGRGTFVCRDASDERSWCQGHVRPQPGGQNQQQQNQQQQNQNQNQQQQNQNQQHEDDDEDDDDDDDDDDGICPQVVENFTHAQELFVGGTCSHVAKGVQILCWDDHRYCPIAVEGKFECPPEVVGSWAELSMYCPSGGWARNGTYQCGRWCRGIMDEAKPIPDCRPESVLPSCDIWDYFSVCSIRDYFIHWCDPIPRNDTPTAATTTTTTTTTTKESSEAPTFVCWDKWDDRWCRGKIQPRSGSFDEPSCPDHALRSCDDTTGYGIRRQFCTCSKSDPEPRSANGNGYFQCQTPLSMPMPTPTPTDGRRENWSCNGTFQFPELPSELLLLGESSSPGQEGGGHNEWQSSSPRLGFGVQSAIVITIVSTVGTFFFILFVIWLEYRCRRRLRSRGNRATDLAYDDWRQVPTDVMMSDDSSAFEDDDASGSRRREDDSVTGTTATGAAKLEVMPPSPRYGGEFELQETSLGRSDFQIT